VGELGNNEDNKKEEGNGKKGEKNGADDGKGGGEGGDGGIGGETAQSRGGGGLRVRGEVMRRKKKEGRIRKTKEMLLMGLWLARVMVMVAKVLKSPRAVGGRLWLG